MLAYFLARATTFLARATTLLSGPAQGWWLEMPFLEAQRRPVARSHLCSGTLERSYKGANSHREMPATAVALVQARAVRLAFQLAGVFDIVAMRTKRTIRPADRFQVFSGFGFIMEYGV